ncbi:MAG: endolytic transglycosylase MltG [Candidatus Dadabacteria bacterium]|nr:MAG: endolytic transglycosylase MltG [Candidatus Dadabacteria bacterium]
MNRGRWGWGAVAAAAGLAWVAASWFATGLDRPRPAAAGGITIPRGATAAQVARFLTDAGVFAHPALARLALSVTGLPGGPKAGTYRFGAGASARAVLDAVGRGAVEQVRVVLPEGLTAREMARVLGAAGVTDPVRFEALCYDEGAPGRWSLPGPTLEGYLFPDTYRFARDLAPEEVVSALVRRFREVTAPLMPEARARGLDLRSWVTLASMIEKETGVPEERPLVAAVFWNRLRRGMRLESDPTVIYGIPDFDGNLTREHLRTDHPYNTYVRKGLPAGPVANPGRESLEAAVRPAPVSYLYFVSRNDGTHVFSDTYEEHRRWVGRYQKRRR